MKRLIWNLRSLVAVLAIAAMPTGAQSPAAPATAIAPKLSEHVKSDIERHRAMAQAHEAAARCLLAGQAEAVCLKALQVACKGLAIGKYCGMRHEH